MSPGRRRRNCAAHCVLRSASSQLTWTPIAVAVARDLCLDAVRLFAAHRAQQVDSCGAFHRCLLLHRGGTYSDIIDFGSLVAIDE